MSPYYGCFSDYGEDELKERIAYWETAQANSRDYTSLDFGVLELLYAERDARVDRQLIAWIEGK